MNLTKKQQENIKIAEENIKDLSTVPDILFKSNYLRPLGLMDLIEEKSAISPEKAFFAYTERGVKPIKCSDVRRLIRLIWGHRRIALNEKFLREGVKK